MKSPLIRCSAAVPVFLRLTVLVLVCLASLSFSRVQASTLFFDDFSTYTGINSGATPMTNVWTRASGSSAVTVNSIITSDASLETPYLQIGGNSVWSTVLSQPVTTSFTLSSKVLLNAYSRSLWIGMFDSTGTQGYVAFWNANTAADFNSEGSLRLKEVSVATTADVKYDLTTATNLNTSAVASGHNPDNTTSAAISGPLAQLTLSWDADTHTLSLYMDGVLKASAVNTDITSFSTLYIGGSTGGKFTDISLTVVPEPGTLGLLSVGVVLLLASIRRPRNMA